MARAKTTKKTTAAKKSATKKPTRKTTAKKTTARKAAPKAAARKAAPKKNLTTAIKDSWNKSEIYNYIADVTDVSKKDVGTVFETFANVMERHLKRNAAGEFTVPGLMKCKVQRKPATKARKGVNPFTGEEMMFKAKPARNIVKIRPLKKVKEMAE